MLKMRLLISLASFICQVLKYFAAYSLTTICGLILLGVIEKYRQQSECKTYLGSQNDDLIEALDILEDVICKTHNCFKNF